MNETVFLAELAWPAFKRAVDAGAPVFLPLGSTEQHGHHMPMNVDVVLPTEICVRAARRVGGLVAPAVPFGNRSQPRSGGGPAFPGTLNLKASTFSAVVRDVLGEFVRHGVTRIAVVNGHYENIWPSIEGIELALEGVDREVASRLTILRIDLWEMIRPETLQRVFPAGYPGIELEHASVIETSMMLALRPDLVDLAAALHDGPARFKPYDRFPRPPEEVPPSGVLSLTKGSSAEKGTWLLDDTVEGLERAARREFDLETTAA